jgi:hypothetical protein
MYEWLDPADAAFVASARETLKIERKAWELCHQERMRLINGGTMRVVLFKIKDGATNVEQVANFEMPARDFAKAASGLILHIGEHYSFMRIEGNVAFFMLSSGVVCSADFLGR